MLLESSPVPVSDVALAVNGGLGPALDVSLTASRYDVVARMDSDDVSMPHRFAVQLRMIEDADIVGAAMLEFADDIDHIVGRRVPPTVPDQIRRYARMHDPFNHPTVVYRLQAAGGYGDVALMEDYLLFARMLGDGAEPANVAEPLVYYRVGAGAYRRRGGRVLLQSELLLQRQLRGEGFTSEWPYRRNVLIRAPYRLVPWQLRRALYRTVVATRFETEVDEAAVLLPLPDPADPELAAWATG